MRRKLWTTAPLVVFMGLSSMNLWPSPWIQRTEPLKASVSSRRACMRLL
jgi:hypothetical protein